MGIIYQIVCNITGEIYIGSTMRALSYRMYQHKGKDNSCCSKQILDRGDYTVNLLQRNNLNGFELRKVEQHCIDTTQNCINQKRAHNTKEQKKEMKRQYKIKNKDKVKEHNRRYREKHREKIKENREKLNEYTRQLYHYQNSWGGDKRYNNNLLCIDVDLFRV